ncbi:uncharacterized protein LOC134177676 [Corticium candelabrum]|uniref:uncharacterized protein LOC134177676 n=1 Tax=Corticium candelabrum TaxID=121492 RepID=UPI002E263BF4|nr:uncharacterized protein LOC134177676 [Corticium candelabrum]
MNRNGLPSPVDSDRFSIVGADSSVPILTISPLNCDGDSYSISSENILGISQPYYWNITTRMSGNNYSSNCEVINDTSILTCFLSLSSVHATSPPTTRPSATSSPVSIISLPNTYTPRGSGLPTRSCADADRKTNLELTVAVATLAVFSIILLVLAAYFFYQWRHVIAVGGAKEPNATRMDEREERHDAATLTYETVVDSGRQPDVLTRSPLYEETSVIDNPSYGVVTDQN